MAGNPIRRLASDLPAFQQDAPSIGWVDAVGQVKHRRFASPIRTDEAEDFTLVQGKIEILHCLQAPEFLAQTSYREERGHSSHRRVRGHQRWTKPNSPPGTNITIISSSVPAMTSWKWENASAVSR